MVIDMKNQEWEVKERFLIEEKDEMSGGFIKRIKFFYSRSVVNKTKSYLNKIKSKMEEPMFPF